MNWKKKKKIWERDELKKKMKERMVEEVEDRFFLFIPSKGIGFHKVLSISNGYNRLIISNDNKF